MIDKYILKPCPFCKGKVKIVVRDDEGNDHSDDYENGPWSGLGYKLRLKSGTTLFHKSNESEVMIYD